MTREEQLAAWKLKNEKHVEFVLELEPAEYKRDENGDIVYEVKSRLIDMDGSERIEYDYDKPVIAVPALLASCTVKKPTLDLINMVTDQFADKASQAGMVLLDNCWVSGDEIIREVEELKLSAGNKMFSLFQTKLVEIKKK
jgi:hypothetical protein